MQEILAGEGQSVPQNISLSRPGDSQVSPTCLPNFVGKRGEATEFWVPDTFTIILGSASYL